VLAVRERGNNLPHKNLGKQRKEEGALIKLSLKKDVIVH
jgi:hypothetical protein